MGKAIKEPELINVEQRNFANPENFKIRPFEERTSVRPGQKVKVGVEFPQLPSGVHGERFWVHVSSKDKQGYVGAVDNELVFTDQHGLKLHDVIRFRADNIMEIWNG